jgi:SH3 domain protein
MRYISIIFAMVIIASNVYVVPAEAETRYVGDQLIITLRQGTSTKHKILKTLETGTPVEVVGEDSSYYKVRTSDGTEGYVLRQYISSNPPKSLRIDELEIENSALLKKNDALQKSKSALEMQLKEIEGKYDGEISSLTTKSTDIKQSLDQAVNNERIITEKYNTLVAQSENVVKIAKERDQLLQKNKKLVASFKELQEKNEKFAFSRMIKWFLAGGGVFFFGWLIGKISRKKRSRF